MFHDAHLSALRVPSGLRLDSPSLSRARVLAAESRAGPGGRARDFLPCLTTVVYYPPVNRSQRTGPKSCDAIYVRIYPPTRVLGKAEPCMANLASHPLFNPPLPPRNPAVRYTIQPGYILYAPWAIHPNTLGPSTWKIYDFGVGTIPRQLPFTNVSPSFFAILFCFIFLFYFFFGR